jgi:hypothetical protein
MRAPESVVNQRQSYGDEITQLLRLARREKFRQEEERRITQVIELQSYLNLLVDEDVRKRMEEAGGGDAEAAEQIRAQGQLNKEQLNTMFAQVS